MHGKELLTALGTLAPDAPAAAVLRHAARFPIVDSSQPTFAEITPEGAAAAEAMGRAIVGFDSVRLLHSPVKRCRQTAECLARGAAQAGLKVELVGPQVDLGVDYILDLSEAGRLTDLHGEHFVRMWLKREIPETVVRAAQHLAETKLSYLVRHLQEPSGSGRRLDLHVTHDWNVLVLRELTLGLRHEDLGWLTFLDGLALSLSSGVLEVVYREGRMRQTLPWKWV